MNYHQIPHTDVPEPFSAFPHLGVKTREIGKYDFAQSVEFLTPASGKSRTRHEGIDMRRAAGFSLIELLIVIAILGVLLAIGYANLPRDRLAVNQAAEGLARDVQLARFEAVRRNWFVGIHFETGEGGSRYLIYCDHPGSGNGDCRSHDFDPDPSLSTRSYEEGDAILKEVRLGAGGNTLAFIEEVDGADDILFDPRGVAVTAANHTVSIASSRSDYLKDVVITPQGKASIE